MKLVCIEGNIGVGKTTLALALAEKINAEFLSEQFESNPFLADFYVNPADFALQTEMFFLEQRANILMDITRSEKIFIADFSVAKSILFAQINLAGEQFEQFKTSYEKIVAGLPKPDAIIYLQGRTSELLENIRRRGREMEKTISQTYLSQVENQYRRSLYQFAKTPVLKIQMDYSLPLAQLVNDCVAFLEDNNILTMNNKTP